jgi:hypothetical protein
MEMKSRIHNVHGCKELLNQKNYIMKNKRMTEMYIEEMKRQFQERDVI